jgi:tetratricopeptide (TPR) repeat protein
MTFPSLTRQIKAACLTVLTICTLLANVHTPSLALDYMRLNQYSNNARYAEKQGNYPEAIKWEGKCIALNPTEAIHYLSRGILKDKAKDFYGAIKDLTKAITLGSKTASVYVHRGGAQASVGDLNGALTDFNKAYSLEPNNPTILGNIGVELSDIATLKHNKGDESGACYYLNQAITYLSEAKKIALEAGDTSIYQWTMKELRDADRHRSNAECN